MTMTSCACGGVPLHGDLCCWCWVFEHVGAPHEGHADCLLAAKRLVPIKARFRSAVDATRENCIRVLEETKANVAKPMGKVVRDHVRRRPEEMVPRILDMLIEATITQIRLRVKAP